MKEAAVKPYYEKDARDYEETHYRKANPYPTLRYRHNYMLEMVKDAKLPMDAKILDVGCGPGEMVIDLMQNDWEIWGVDIAQEMINIAREKVDALDKKNKVHLSVGDIKKLDFIDQQFDLIIVSGVIEYLAEDETWSKEIDRLLKPGGHLLINVTNKYAVRGWTSGIIEPLKRWKPVYGLMNFIKEKVLRRGKLNYFPFRPRRHSPKGFDQFLEKKGFKKVSHNYFDFSILVAPFDTLFGFITTPIKKWMERFSKKNMVLNGMGYIVHAQKNA